jgi:hypothetical protein
MKPQKFVSKWITENTLQFVKTSTIQSPSALQVLTLSEPSWFTYPVSLIPTNSVLNHHISPPHSPLNMYSHTFPHHSSLSFRKSIPALLTEYTYTYRVMHTSLTFIPYLSHSRNPRIRSVLVLPQLETTLCIHTTESHYICIYIYIYTLICCVTNDVEHPPQKKCQASDLVIYTLQTPLNVSTIYIRTFNDSWTSLLHSFYRLTSIYIHIHTSLSHFTHIYVSIVYSSSKMRSRKCSRRYVRWSSSQRRRS